VIARHYFFLTTYLWTVLYILEGAEPRRFRVSWRAPRRIGKVNWELDWSEVPSLSMLNNVLRWISYGLAILALVAGIALLFGDAKLGTLSRFTTAAISAAPLLLVGTSFLILQPILRPRLMELLKNVLLAATFLLWGIIQLLPRNATSMRLGDVVIALYVLDLAWVIFSSKISVKRR
jgi:hypothetical protein